MFLKMWWQMFHPCSWSASKQRSHKWVSYYWNRCYVLCRSVGSVTQCWYYGYLTSIPHAIKSRYCKCRQILHISWNWRFVIHTDTVKNPLHRQSLWKLTRQSLHKCTSHLHSIIHFRQPKLLQKCLSLHLQYWTFHIQPLRGSNLNQMRGTGL